MCAIVVSPAQHIHLLAACRRETCRKSGLEHIHEYSWHAHCARYIAVLDETHKQLPTEQQHELLYSAHGDGPPAENVTPPPERMLVVTMCTKDAREGAQILQRALDAISTHAEQLQTVAIVVASALPVQACLCARDVPFAAFV
jgi:hypothetical protein